MSENIEPGAPVRVTHSEVAQRLGLTVGAVSRLRSGERQPSFALMVTIAGEYDWPIEKQAVARAEGQWLYAFEGVLRGA